ncbi:protein disulfide oxidoreductase [Parashewanella spongiae]|uniref:Protein disulfide oxidoreductase n=2 Tax=Parashewanella spongiae TaxID=342950 RepID=A0A3A6U151_9GAMM|nr:protein disulfide oxidoreductase [Parashewanella spongiae]MCL1077010.1 protein disulfide oxidoreductase [Parashewanella spongiae]RJY19115.1 protein disulfide oxidoreductase [Parashewanella spongiae]
MLKKISTPLYQKLKSREFWLKLTKELVIVIALVSALSFYLQFEMASGHAPKLTTETINGKPIDLATLSSDKPTLVYFWGSWCGYCKFTSPMVESISKDHPVISIAIASGKNWEVQQYLEQKQLSFAAINDINNTISQAWGVNGVPAIFVIDKNGNIASKTTGPTSNWGMRLRLWLASF